MHSIFFYLAVNECDSALINDCHVNASCTDTLQGFFCTCNSGFVGDGMNCSSKCEEVQ